MSRGLPLTRAQTTQACWSSWSYALILNIHLLHFPLNRCNVVFRGVSLTSKTKQKSPNRFILDFMNYIHYYGAKIMNITMLHCKKNKIKQKKPILYLYFCDKEYVQFVWLNKISSNTLSRNELYFISDAENWDSTHWGSLEF